MLMVYTLKNVAAILSYGDNSLQRGLIGVSLVAKEHHISVEELSLGCKLPCLHT